MDEAYKLRFGMKTIFNYPVHFLAFYYSQYLWINLINSNHTLIVFKMDFFLFLI